MKTYNKIDKILFAAGGTGGHLFPALSIANEIRHREPDAEFLFVGNKNRIEGTQVPKLGFEFEPISMIGMPRKVSFKIVKFIWNFLKSLIESYKILKAFKPKIIFGTGGYVSVAPILIANYLKIPNCMIEPNLFPGVATKLLAKNAKRVYLSFEKSGDYFKSKTNILVSGTPVRMNLELKSREESADYFKLSSSKKTILILGGSLGAKSINEKTMDILEKITQNYQLIWQCGKFYIKDLSNKVKSESVFLTDFLDRMDLAYSLADIVISRAGASTISEITYYGLASILIPSPNVADNHQYYNAKILSDKNAALLFEDRGNSYELLKMVSDLLKNEPQLIEIKKKSKSLSRPNAAAKIVDDMLEIINNNSVTKKEIL